MENKKAIEELAKEEQRKYQRQWRAKNRDKVASINRRYWEKKAAELAASKQAGESNGNKND